MIDTLDVSDIVSRNEYNIDRMLIVSGKCDLEFRLGNLQKRELLKSSLYTISVWMNPSNNGRTISIRRFCGRTLNRWKCVVDS